MKTKITRVRRGWWHTVWDTLAGILGIQGLYGISQHPGELRNLQAMYFWNFLFSIFGYSSEATESETVSNGVGWGDYCTLLIGHRKQAL